MRGDITISRDGYSIKGCSIIYAPRGQAGEYAPLAVNPYRGCGNGCLYCYVPDVIKISREEFDEAAVPRDRFLDLLRRDARKYLCAELTDQQVMLSFTTDPYHPGETSLTREVLIALIKYGFGICTLTKGGRRALRDIDLFRPERDAFASSLTCLDDDRSRRWERNAALPADRIETLREFHRRGVFTWVSLEPVLDTETTLEIIRRTHEFVDLFKIGRINHSELTGRINWHEFTDQVVELVNELGAPHYIKRDLQKYLPAGYANEMRREQRREQRRLG